VATKVGVRAERDDPRAQPGLLLPQRLGRDLIDGGAADPGGGEAVPRTPTRVAARVRVIVDVLTDPRLALAQVGDQDEVLSVGPES